MRYSFFLIGCFLLFSAGLNAQTGNGELLLFHDGSDHPVTRDFVDRYVPQIKEMAAGQEIEVKLMDLSQGAPEMVEYTPAVVFQNHLGRSLYVGRYHYVDKIKTFLRTVRRMPQKEVVNEKHQVLVWEKERATVISPVKITDLAGHLPKDLDQNEFRNTALAAIARGMEGFRQEAHFKAARTHRLMYTAFYPYRSKDGKLFISTEVYSQFNCIDPVFKEFEAPVEASWKEWESAFEAAGRLLKEKILTELENPERGDGFLPVARSVAPQSWEALGLALPEAPEGSGNDFSEVDLNLPPVWEVDGPIDGDVPVVNFSFLAPLDYYAGEITALSGKLNLGADKSIASATASFVADLKDLTMGDEYLDESVATMIELADHPQASFTFRSVSVVDQPVVDFGNLTQFVVEGTMDFKGIQAPLRVSGQIEPILNEAGEPRLQVYAAFQLKQYDNYGVKGPDGPEEASHTMDFNLNFLLRPAAN